MKKHICNTVKVCVGKDYRNYRLQCIICKRYVFRSEIHKGET